MEATTTNTASQQSPWRYRGTLLLFAGVVAAVVVWFQRHIEPYVTETLIIGGTISLWGLWKLVWSIFEDAGGEGGKDLTKKFLGSPAATRALWFAALIVTLLHFFTASIYLRVVGGQSGEDTFRVQILDAHQRVFMGPFELHPGDVAGHPIFPSFTTLKLEYQILSPRGFGPLPMDLRPWGAHDVQVPGSFPTKKYHVVVLVPDKVLFSQLPPPGVPGGDRYYLNVTIKGRTDQVKDYSQQLVVTGAASEDLPGETEISRDTAIRQELMDHYAHAEIARPEEVVAALLDASVARLGSAEADSDERIDVEVGTWESVNSETKPHKAFGCHFRAPKAGVPQTRVIGILEVGECK